MTQRMSDGDIEYHRNECSIPYLYRFQFQEGFRSAESIYIPQIEKLQGEIERLNRSPISILSECFDKIHIGDTIDTALIEYGKRMEKELAQLTAKHDRLVKAAQEFHDYVIIHPVKAFDVPDEIYIPFNNALTEEGNV